MSWVIELGVDYPGWIGILGVMLVVASALGTAVAVYRTSLQSTSLREAERTMERLRGEIADYQRRESEMAGDIRVLKEQNDSKEGRIRILEDLISKRQDDKVIRDEIANIKKAVDEKVMSQLGAILNIMNSLKAGGNNA